MNTSRILIKYGGNAMIHEHLKVEIAQQLKELQDLNYQVVLVHGGGPFINRALEDAGISSVFYDGHRYTSVEALRCIERTLKGEVNSSLVSALNRSGMKAVGISGKDGKFAIATKRHQEKKLPDGTIQAQDLGAVGDLVHVDTNLIDCLLRGGYTPIIACLASDEAGNDYNVNGDAFAGRIAAALHVDAYVVLTDVDGLYRSFPDPGSLIPTISSSELQRLFGTAITGGMIPKIASCLEALQHGVKKVAILNGTKPEYLTDMLVDQKQCGTVITP
ncbi:acetylglutamate kinase [Lunatimonas salinarum]|uniref:acetylglutamate kinase n=1 Tax=Lunatimonas salinarum TaxID=1774590 RepID=UPI001ADF7E81|nr:acetylglutamate kinase [Lunatimonas salinarum]